MHDISGSRPDDAGNTLAAALTVVSCQKEVA